MCDFCLFVFTSGATHNFVLVVGPPVATVKIFKLSLILSFSLIQRLLPRVVKAHKYCIFIPSLTLCKYPDMVALYCLYLLMCLFCRSSSSLFQVVAYSYILLTLSPTLSAERRKGRDREGG